MVFVFGTASGPVPVGFLQVPQLTSNVQKKPAEGPFHLKIAPSFQRVSECVCMQVHSALPSKVYSCLMLMKIQMNHDADQNKSCY